MSQGITFFIRYSFKNKKSYLLSRLAVELGGITDWLLGKYDHYMGQFCKETVPIHRHDLQQKSVTAVTGFLQQAVTYGYLFWQAAVRKRTIAGAPHLHQGGNTLNSREKSGRKKGGQPGHKGAALTKADVEARLLSHLLFLHDFSVPFENNMSERDLRKCKDRQKIAGGFRKQSGNEMYCCIMSIIVYDKLYELSIKCSSLFNSM